MHLEINRNSGSIEEVAFGEGWASSAGDRGLPLCCACLGPPGLVLLSRAGTPFTSSSSCILQGPGWALVLFTRLQDLLKSGQPRGSKQPIVAPEWLVLPARPGLVSSSCMDQGARIRTGYEHWPPRTTEAPHSSSCPPYPNLQVVPQGSPPQLTAPTTRCRLQGSVYGVGTEVLFTWQTQTCPTLRFQGQVSRVCVCVCDSGMWKWTCADMNTRLVTGVTIQISSYHM